MRLVEEKQQLQVKDNIHYKAKQIVMMQIEYQNLFV